MENKHDLRALDDTELANYLHAINLKWIKGLQKYSTRMSINDRQKLIVRNKAIVIVYGRAVTEAINRGILIVH